MLIVQSCLPAVCLHEARGGTLPHDERVPVDTGHQAEADCSPYGLCDFALVLGSQTGVFGVLYSTRLRHVL
jgi:hypothetical protein